MIIQTYILKTILHRTTFLTAVACLIIAMINSITLLEFLVKKSLTGMGFLLMIAYVLPQYMVMTLPFTIFISTLMTYNSLLQTRELTILHSIGRSPLQILRPAIYAGGICAVISLIGYGYLMPEGWHKFQTTKHRITHQTLLSKQVIAGKFQNIGNNSTMFVESVNGNRVKNIFIYSGKEHVILTATDGEILDSPTQTQIILQNGTQQSSLDGDSQPPIISFAEYVLSFNTPFTAYVGKQKTDELTNTELFYLYKMFPTKHTYINELSRRIIDASLPFLLSLMGVFTVIFKPMNRMENRRYTIIGSICMVSVIATAMTFSIRISESIVYLYYNGILIFGLSILLLGGIIIYCIHHTHTVKSPSLPHKGYGT